MPKIAIIADSDASLSEDQAARHGIRLVPIHVQYGGKDLLTGRDINDQQLFELVDRDGKLPTTSAPSPGDFCAAYEAAFADGADAAICYCVSSAISGTYNAAIIARDTMPDRDITVVDTQALSMTQGFMALEAADAAAHGASMDEVLERAGDVGGRTHLFAALATLRYLAMSGRVGHVAAGMASVLNIKPILTVRDGKLDMLEKVRTRKRAWARTIELADESLNGQPCERAAVLHVAVPADADAFEAQLRTAIDCPEEIMRCELTAGLSVHAGAGLVGVTVVAAPL